VPSHPSEGLALANETLKLYPIDRVLRPVMNSIRQDVERRPHKDRSGHSQALKPIPINDRPLDNEYAWKGSPYELDGWLKPNVTAFAVSCDDPQVAWFCDSSGRAYRTVDHGQTWDDVTTGLMGASVENLVTSKTRTFVLWAKAGSNVYVTRDGGLSWRVAVASDSAPAFAKPNFDDWLSVSKSASLRIAADQKLVRSRDGGKTSEPAMNGWRIPLAKSVFRTPWGILASGPGGAYLSADGEVWRELKLWREEETGAADYLHAYWMGRYCGFIAID
jgi:hypothetical protein